MEGLLDGESGLVATGRLLIAFGFLIAAFRNTSTSYQIHDHIARLKASGIPFPGFAFWAGTTIELTGCALIAANWHAAIGVYCLLFFTIAATGSLLRFWEISDKPRRSGMQNGFMANISVCGGLLLLLSVVQ